MHSAIQDHIALGDMQMEQAPIWEFRNELILPHLVLICILYCSTCNKELASVQDGPYLTVPVLLSYPHQL